MKRFSLWAALAAALATLAVPALSFVRVAAPVAAAAVVLESSVAHAEDDLLCTFADGGVTSLCPFDGGLAPLCIFSDGGTSISTPIPQGLRLAVQSTQANFHYVVCPSAPCVATQNNMMAVQNFPFDVPTTSDRTQLAVVADGTSSAKVCVFQVVLP